MLFLKIIVLVPVLVYQRSAHNVGYLSAGIGSNGNAPMPLTDDPSANIGYNSVGSGAIVLPWSDIGDLKPHRHIPVVNGSILDDHVTDSSNYNDDAKTCSDNSAKDKYFLYEHQAENSNYFLDNNTSTETINGCNLLLNHHTVGAFCRTNSPVPAQKDDRGLPLVVCSFSGEINVNLYEGPVLDATTGVVMKNQVAIVIVEKFVRHLLKNIGGTRVRYIINHVMTMNVNNRNWNFLTDILCKSYETLMLIRNKTLNVFAINYADISDELLLKELNFTDISEYFTYNPQMNSDTMTNCFLVNLTLFLHEVYISPPINDIHNANFNNSECLLFYEDIYSVNPVNLTNDFSEIYKCCNIF